MATKYVHDIEVESDSDDNVIWPEDETPTEIGRAHV